MERRLLVDRRAQRRVLMNKENTTAIHPLTNTSTLRSRHLKTPSTSTFTVHSKKERKKKKTEEEKIVIKILDT